MTELTNQEKKEMLYISLLALSAAPLRWATNTACEVPELLYILEPDVFLKLSSVYPKKIVRIPSKQELVKTMKLIKYYQDVLIKGKSREQFLKDSKLIMAKSFSLETERKAKELRANLKSCGFKIPAAFMQSGLLKTIQEDLLGD